MRCFNLARNNKSKLFPITITLARIIGLDNWPWKPIIKWHSTYDITLSNWLLIHYNYSQLFCVYLVEMGPSRFQNSIFMKAKSDQGEFNSKPWRFKNKRRSYYGHESDYWWDSSWCSWSSYNSSTGRKSWRELLNG